MKTKTKVPDKIKEQNIKARCVTCKKETLNDRVFQWLYKRERYSTASVLRCSECGTHWDYLF
jgi:uncharacterized Zn finger protein